MIRVLLIFLGLHFFQFAKSQSIEFGFIAGTSVYNGDLSPDDYVKYLEDIHPAGGIFLRRIVHPKLSVRASLIIGALSADDNGRVNEIRGLNFRSPLIELSAIGEIHPLRSRRNMRAPNFSPYLFGGVATYYFNPKTDYQGEKVELQPIGTEGQGVPGGPEQYSRVQFSIPMGFGVHIRINSRLSLGAEFGARKLFTDYLDDVGSQAVNYGNLVRNNGTIAGELSVPNPDWRPTEQSDSTYTRGKASLDWYYVGGITLGFKLQNATGGQFGCPNF